MVSVMMAAGMALVAAPVALALAAYPDTFELGWNQGRGGALFAVAFAVAELAMLRVDISARRAAACVPIAAGAIAYIVAAESGLRESLASASATAGVELSASWTWMWDIAIITAFMVATLHVLLGRRWLRLTPAGPIFLGGSALILGLDAYFPYNRLGALQYVVPYMVELNVWLVTAFDLGTAIARDNMMFLSGDHGHFALQVFWPSAGVHSIIIYSLVMMAFLLKMRVPARRKAVWFAVGIVGTVAVNVVRIFLLSWYALKVTADAERWEEFHSVAGEIMFLPWLFAFIAVVMAVETRRARRLERAQA
ncbi:MAG: thaumarchaeosortase [Thaumarchaeota archaeon]|nr:thaumarchaeosortase [Nitrososphaerota archaeon]MDD9814202.1 thaumarchaeosortase [Nitrososphaerota archaeon]MDD9843362.1 thaumarchaeosortase [Nitrososphaerota archaeon]